MGIIKTATDVLAEYDRFKERPLKQFMLLADYLNNYADESCRFSVDSLNPIDIKFYYRFKDKHLLIALCIAKLENDKKLYEIDDMNTLYVVIKDAQTLEILCDILHRILKSVILNSQNSLI